MSKLLRMVIKLLRMVMKLLLLIFAAFVKGHSKDKKPDEGPIVRIDCAQVIVSGKRTKLQISALNAENG
jgi:hypothetical protein